MLELFPTASIDTSILTSVLVGLLVVWVLQETLGWNFTGLVVPGYLASVLTFEPVTGLVMSVEAVLTYLLVFALSDAVPRWVPWSRLFGRDRFFALLLGSVVVRLALEGGGFDRIYAALGGAGPSRLHSMGLLVVPLAANALWRMGLGKGLPRLGIPVVITWFVLDRVLLAYTNLSLGRFELTYDQLALDFVSTPRAYMVLLFGAWLGSLGNLRYGWDLGGIIVPGLLALCWFEPVRILATSAEAAAIALLLAGVVRMPPFRTSNLAGGRTLVLAFVLAYAAKWLLSSFAGELWPGLRVRDLYGYGYLLPTLMALRMHAHKEPFRMLVPALSCATGGFLGATALGYGLATVLPPTDVEPADIDPTRGPGRVELLVAAARDLGPPPRRADLGAVPTGGVLVGGGGFGALWHRGGAGQIAVVVTDDDDLVGAAALGIAEALDARAVLLCARPSTACSAARTGLARALAVVDVSGAPTTRRDGVEVTGSPLAGLDDGAHHTLALDIRPRARLAAAALGADPQPLPGVDIALRRLPGADIDPGVPRVVWRHLGAAWTAWRVGLLDDDGLRAMAGLAAGLGMTVYSDGHDTVIRGPDLLAVARRDAASEVHIAVPSGDDRTLRDAAVATFEALDAATLVIDVPGEVSAELYPTGRPAHVLALSALAGSGGRGEVLVLRALRDYHDAGADVVLSIGRPVAPERPEPQLASDVDALFRRTGATVRRWDGDYRRLSTSDPSNPLRRAAQAAAGAETEVTAFLTSRTRALLARSRLDDPALAALPRESAPLRDWMGTAMATGPAEVAEPRALACAPLLGCRWVLVDAPGCSPCLLAADGVAGSGPDAATALFGPERR